MFEIKHTLCPSCSVGCGINVILDDGVVVGTFPYKRHPVNEGKNCLNGRNSIKSVDDCVDSDASVLADVSKKLKSCDNDKVTVVFSGNNSNEDLGSIKSFCESNGYQILSYADNLKKFDTDVSYDDIENATSVFVIGNILYDNPLIGRRIVHAKENGAKIYVNDDLENSPTANIADEFSSKSVKEFLETNNGNFDDGSIILFNKVDSFEDLDLFESTNSKILPVYSKSNTKGALELVEAVSKEDAVELLNDTEVLLVFNDDIVNDIDFDFKSINTIVSFSPYKNDTTEISDFVVPIKSWLECDGSFTNSGGLTQEFKSVHESSENMDIDEIINKINGEME